MGRYCKKCREEIVREKPGPTVPEWARGCECLRGWRYLPRTGVVIRFSPVRSFEVDEDGDLIIHSYAADYSEAIEFLTVEGAVKVANLIAEMDGGWTSEEEEAEIDKEMGPRLSVPVIDA